MTTDIEDTNTRLALTAHRVAQQQRALRSHALASDNDASKQIGEWIEEARRAVAFTHHTPPGFDEPTHIVRKSPSISREINLNRAFLPSLFDKDGKLIRTPAAKIAATTIPLSAAILNASRVAAAGAHVIVQPEPSRAVPTGKTGDVVLQRNATAFRTVSAAHFGIVADGDDVPTAPHPALSAEIDWQSSVSRALRMEFKRTDQRALESGFLHAEIVAAIVMGLARAADEVLLAAIAATAPTPFSLAKVAAQGLKFDELRGTVGTAGAGATVNQDGDLRAAGIPSELTADLAATIVGAWDRAAVAIHEDLPIHFERLNTQGDLVVTAWANLIPLVPDQAKFWTVPA